MDVDDTGGLALLALPVASEVAEAAVTQAASACGVDPYRLRLLLRGKSLTVLARGEDEGIASAARGLSHAGVPCAMVSGEDLRSVERPQIAGGIGQDHSGGVSIRVHGRLAGPPAGVALLLVFGDLGLALEAPSAFSSRPPDTFSQRVLRAAFPVVDLVWAHGRIRIPLRTMAWSGLPEHGFSGPANLLLLLRRLADRAGGTALDAGFSGQEIAVGPVLFVPEVPEGADAERTAHFERYVRAAAAAWTKGIYPACGPGKISAPGETPLPASELFGRLPSAPAPKPVPWTRNAGRSRLRPRLWPWLLGIPLVGSVLDIRGGGAPGFLILAFAVCGAGSLAFGLGALRRRERVRSVPQARIRSMALGPAQVAGRVAGCLPLMSPYSRVRCGWYRLELRTRGEEEDLNRSVLFTAEKGGSGDMPFWLEDETGVVLVQPSGAEVDIEPLRTAVDSRTEAVEWVLAEGQSIFVTGFAQRRSTDAGEPPATSSGRVSERDDVFIGSAPNEPFVIGERSRGKETSLLTRAFILGTAAGGLYLLVALLLWIERLSS